MKKYYLLLGVFICAPLLCLIFCVYIYLSWSGALWRWDNRIAQGNVIIAQVEEFKRVHGSLPESLSELGFFESESGPLYYDRKADGKTYIVWFGTTLGESVIYRSELDEWRDY